jgi:hypothetical protein
MVGAGGAFAGARSALAAVVAGSASASERK